jgi:hypothetical protein
MNDYRWCHEVAVDEPLIFPVNVVLKHIDLQARRACFNDLVGVSLVHVSSP